MRISSLRAEIVGHETTSCALVESCLEQVACVSGQGAKVFTQVFADQALQCAAALDASADRIPSGELRGIPVSIKDLFDVAGCSTTAGSTILRDAPPARAHAPAVSRLLQHGAVIIGKTNMTEFAYSGLGVNPHYGTPLNPYDRLNGRIPGGSSSGAAVSVCDRMSFAALGSDTGGSVRIPAAFCGLTGWKPTAQRISREGLVPLSASLDGVGVIASTAECCAILDEALTGQSAPATLSAEALTQVRIALPRELFCDNADQQVLESLQRCVERLRDRGVQITEVSMPVFADIVARGAGPVIVASEAYAWHREMLSRDAGRYDPRVRVRIERGAAFSEDDYLNALRERQCAIEQVRVAMGDFSAWIMPTVPIVAPPLKDLESDEAYTRLNSLTLRNPAVVNFIDGCAISLPVAEHGAAPIGLSIAGRHGSDSEILSLAQTIELLLAD